MKILLVNPPCRIAWHIPIGLGYIASVALQAGHKVDILDINGLGYSSDEVKKELIRREFDILGIGGLSPTYKYVKWLASTSKACKPRVPVVAGNMVSTAHPEALLKNSQVDIAVADEGEETFRELVSVISDGRELDTVKGIYYKTGPGVIVKNPPRERIADLDSLPFPAWDLFPLGNYWKNLTESPARFGMRSMMVSAVRGCPYDCIFCSHPFGKVVRTRSAQSLVNEVRELKKRYNIQCINMSDDLFMVNKKLVLEFCNRLILEKLNINWYSSARVNLVDKVLLKNMRRAGCVEVSYGFESGNQYMLDKMKKRFTVKQSEEAIKMTREAGIKVCGSFVLGMPGETLDSIKDTIAFIKRTRLDLRRFFYATPYPGTELYEIAGKMGRLPKDEDRYIESLGEMRTTFLVNVTDFSDKELVRLKNWAEKTVWENFTLKLKLNEWIEEWQRRFVVVRLSLRDSGMVHTLKYVASRAARKISAKAQEEPRA